jgi:uncharacterized protein YhfF
MSRFATDRPDVVALMKEASEALGRPLAAPKDVFHFGHDNNPKSGDGRLRDALDGLKTATTSWPVPSPRYWDAGDLSVILNGEGQPVAVMRTLSLVECKFKDVAEDFALAENEGTYEDYREGHIHFYNSQGKGHFDDESMVLCERFEIIYEKKA